MLVEMKYCYVYFCKYNMMNADMLFPPFTLYDLKEQRYKRIFNTTDEETYQIIKFRTGYFK